MCAHFSVQFKIRIKKCLRKAAIRWLNFNDWNCELKKSCFFPLFFFVVWAEKQNSAHQQKVSWIRKKVSFFFLRLFFFQVSKSWQFCCSCFCTCKCLLKPMLSSRQAHTSLLDANSFFYEESAWASRRHKQKSLWRKCLLLMKRQSIASSLVCFPLVFLIHFKLSILLMNERQEFGVSVCRLSTVDCRGGKLSLRFVTTFQLLANLEVWCVSSTLFGSEFEFKFWVWVWIQETNWIEQ